MIPNNQRRLCLFLLILIVAINNDTKAQNPLSLGVKGGVNFSNIGHNDFKAKTGYNIGVVTDFNLDGGLSLMSGLEINTKGAKASNTAMDINATYIHLPLHVGYKMFYTRNFLPYFSIGTYLAGGIGGKTDLYTIENEASPFIERTDTFGDDAPLKRLDWGVGIGMGASIGRYFTIRFGYDHGILNISNIKDLNIKNRSVYISAGVLFF